ncbi:Os08g0453766 [Oryza sativa Japonica Group]|uniref:Os08g0453766 protein n=1 Tax=Oryza sativa subsp. japonica TaxID=39947 RepID=A0A0P0XGX2_ORYSJ|nr:hypothetical protein EE612_044660 [Oryza sativa]BAT05721.1 Os08g0453766 [Oryza sativa Japonica Group]
MEVWILLASFPHLEIHRVQIFLIAALAQFCQEIMVSSIKILQICNQQTIYPLLQHNLWHRGATLGVGTRE